ncbi:MAG: DUF4399 domain-containing protein [Gemmatimonadota bacterium]
MKGATVAPTFTVKLAAHGVQVVPADGRREEGKGHHHLFLDADVTPSDSVIPKTVQIVHLGNGANEYQFANVTPGKHRLIAVLAWGDHVPMKGVMADTVTFTVKAP